MNVDEHPHRAKCTGGEVARSVGVVVIGRNEGERLERCLTSVLQQADCVVYVDSGSTDNSVAMARSKGVAVVALDMRIPFTAARARNAGFERVREIAPSARYVQFVDGDCELCPQWISTAASFLDGKSDFGVVAGRLKEKFPDASVYNQLCDMEWSVPEGESKTSGGIAMMRVSAYEEVQGFNATLICGEEPELCARLRSKGWRVWRLADGMAWHDANMMHFRQWWVRTVRAGYGFAQAAFMDRSNLERRGARESRSAWFWGGCIPFATLCLALYGGWPALLVLLVYPLQMVRLALRGKRSWYQNWVRAYFLVMGKFPEVVGQVKFKYQQISGQQSGLIEHK